MLISLPNEKDAELFATRCAKHFQELNISGLRIYLMGDLGAGKTFFTRHFLRQMGVSGRIKSPSYTLVEPYILDQYALYHYDFYRFTDIEEWLEAGFHDTLCSDEVINLVEWPQKAGDTLPDPDVLLYFEYIGEGRQVTCSSFTEKGQLFLKELV